MQAGRLGAVRMTTLCHNCRNAVPERAAFCPECGAPQLRVGSPDAPEPTAEGDAATPKHLGEIVWPAAMQSAALYAVPSGLLLALLPLPILDTLWVVMGSVWTLRRYRRRAPRAPVLTPMLGGRIGLVLGLFAAVISTGVRGVSLLVERFALHHGSAMDADVQKAMLDGLGRAKGFYSPDSAAQLTAFAQFLLTPEGRGLELALDAATSAVAVLFFAWLGGRFAVRYSRPRRGTR